MITDKQIEALRSRYIQFGNEVMVRYCNVALGPVPQSEMQTSARDRAREICAAAIKNPAK